MHYMDQCNPPVPESHGWQLGYGYYSVGWGLGACSRPLGDQRVSLSPTAMQGFVF
jgi:hypothetical protein